MGLKQRIHFSLKITLIGVIVALGMIRASFWQWDRYKQKELYIAELDKRITLPPVPISDLLSSYEDASTLLHRRALISGTYDFEHEMVLRNRKDDDDGPGVHVLTPLKIDGTEKFILINRGYIPLSVQDKQHRSLFQSPSEAKFIGLLKLTSAQKFLAPSDPPVGGESPWVDAWLRVDIDRIQEQLPHKLLPFYAEIMTGANMEETQKEIVKGSKGREQILFLAERSLTLSGPKISEGKLNPDRSYPAPAHSTVVPTATHLAYVYEWAFLAILTLLITLVLQTKKARIPGRDVG
jgi:surfeit locus 1 family protein